MNVKVTRIGDSLAVVLPDDVAARLNAVDGGVLSLDETDGRVSLGRAQGVDDLRPEVMAAHRRSMDRYAGLYKKLAE